MCTLFVSSLPSLTLQAQPHLTQWAYPPSFLIFTLVQPEFSEK